MAKHEAAAEQAVRPRNRKARRTVAAVLAGALLLTCVGGGGYYYLHNHAGKTVNVYPASELGTSDAWYDQVSTGGPVRVDKMQSVYLSSTQTVTGVFVKEGQRVEVGDPILAFDTTLDEVELTRKKIDIQKLELELQKARETLSEINTYRIGVPGGGYREPKATAVPAPPAATTVPQFQGGRGSREDPFVFLWGETDENGDPLLLNDAQVKRLLFLTRPTPTPSPSPSASPEASASPTPSASPEASPAGIAWEGVSVPVNEAAAAPAATLAPVGVGRTVTARGLLSPAGGIRRLADPEPVPAAEATQAPPEETPAPPTEPSEATAVPATDTPVPTDTPAPDRFENKTAREILGMFEALQTQPEELKAFYEGLTQQEKQTAADTLSPEELAGLTAVLLTAGVEEPSFPEPSPGSAGAQPPAVGTAAPAPAAPVPAAPAEADSEQDAAPIIQQAAPAPAGPPLAGPEATAMPLRAAYCMVFETRENDSMQGEILNCFEIEFILTGAGGINDQQWSFRVLDPVYEPQLPEEPEPEADDYGYFDAGNVYTAKEIAEMRAATEREINDKTIQLRMAEQKLKQVEYELSNGEVLCTTAGIVKSVLTPEEALETEQPVVKISGGGGYFITGYMSEFDMDRLQVGDTVTVDNYMAGEQLDAAITEISHYPSAERYVNYYASSINNYTSKYPFTVEVDEDANLREGYYVDITFSASGVPAEKQEGNSFYLQNAFLRTEGGRSYVYAAGPDGLLEKRFVTVGRDLYGSLTEITGGLDPETDYLAFPYGRSVKAGAKTSQQKDADALFGY